MSVSDGTNLSFDSGCDPERVFELADGGLSLEQEEEMREHLASCTRCRELYERELDLNAFLSSLDLSGVCSSQSVHMSVAMALPTRSVRARVLWSLLAFSLLVAALVSLELDYTELVLLAMSALSECWGLVVAFAGVLHAILVAAGPAILLVLALGALTDILLALTVVSLNRVRRTREA